MTKTPVRKTTNADLGKGNVSRAPIADGAMTEGGEKQKGASPTSADSQTATTKQARLFPEPKLELEPGWFYCYIKDVKKHEPGKITSVCQFLKFDSMGLPLVNVFGIGIFSVDRSQLKPLVLKRLGDVGSFTRKFEVDKRQLATWLKEAK